ncbi:HelD family protein [Streptomyces sp. NBC_00690]|uniref:HelD family protein n=1 Tax=Streptomyces sp. NBC_00690 TaxID=2975808 RepID=UPI002E2DBC0F|nr:AAA family ATPase [Streptomyces sp. NBC_00690]
MTHPDASGRHALDALDALDRERAHHDRCRAALTAMTDDANQQLVIGENASASGADAEVLGYQLRTRAAELRAIPPGPLFFGRLDFAPETTATTEHAGQSYHIGRLRITPQPGEPPLVLDWRAPISRAFYQAGPQDPQGIAVRRRFGWRPGSAGDSTDLTGWEDEHLLAGDTRASTLLTEEIERPRIGPMRDIAATIQPEQDHLVRQELGASLCVQGAPGTGKTAVGLHRAAYLLYAHPQRIQRSGMLVLGPHPVFLDHVREVLPALGEHEVRHSTLKDEIARRPVGAQDGEETAVVKHDVRMAGVLRRALYARVRPERADGLVVKDGSARWRVAPEEVQHCVRVTLSEELPYAVGRERVRTRLVDLAQQQAERRAGPRPSVWVQKTTRSRALSALLDTVWPKVSPEAVLTELLGRRAVLERAADNLLSKEQQDALHWAHPEGRAASGRWTAADAVLLDELAGLIEHPRGYGHIVVDEAQDLSPMECRAIARRCVFGSLTVLGDLAQGTTPWAARNWSDTLTHLGRPQAPVVVLNTGFRVPRGVAELANCLLKQLDVAVPPMRSLRRDGEVRIERADRGTAATGSAATMTAVVGAVRAALLREGSIAVIAADAQVGLVRQALTAAGMAVPQPGAGQERVSLLPASAVKGLEFDHVVVVEPAAIARAERRGLHRLYVVLTRAVSRLHIVHSQPLPCALPDPS